MRRDAGGMAAAAQATPPGGSLTAWDRHFRLSERGTTWRREVLAGLTTFATMSYILAVNPRILAAAGMDFSALITVTALGAAVATAVMGFVTNYPLALAPGMGGNAFFAYQVCVALGVPWQAALGLVFYNGVLFLALSWTGGREFILNSIPASLKVAITGGIGLFIALVGLKSGGVLVASKESFIGLAHVTSPGVLLVLGGLVLNVLLLWRRVPGALVIGIAVITVAGLFLPSGSGSGTITPWPQRLVAPPASIAPTFLMLDLGYLWSHFTLAFPIVLILFFGDIMSGLATIMGICERGYLVDAAGQIPKLRPALMVDAAAACFGACLGTSTIALFIESGSGVAVGGRTGLTSLTTAACFLLALVFNPVIAIIPPVATAPALFIVGVLMFQAVAKLDLEDLSIAVPAIATMLIMALANVSDGMAIGILLYLLVMVGTRRAKLVPWTTYLLGAVFIAHFVF